MWIGVLWAGLRVAMWITHVGGKFRHGLLKKSLTFRETIYPSSAVNWLRNVAVCPPSLWGSPQNSVESCHACACRSIPNITGRPGCLDNEN